MLQLADHWVWDSWPVSDEEGRTHLFFLRASRALLDPERRHKRATAGHAVSDDLLEWRLLPDALVPADSPAWDSGAIWTGSTVLGEDGIWRLFYTGASREEDWMIQRVGVAQSQDMTEWHRVGDGALLEAHEAWYERLTPEDWHDEAWRDPWVFRGEDGKWHMLITARVAEGRPFGRGVIGHAVSDDLDNWTVQPPLSQPAGWGHMEVPHTVIVDGQPFLIFSCSDAHQEAFRSEQATGGVWYVPGDSLLGPWHFEEASTFDDPVIYAAHAFERAPNDWVLVGFANDAGDGFLGHVLDPIPFTRVGRTLKLIP